MSNNKYLDLITSEHRDKPKFIAWLTANLNILDDIYISISNLDGDFDLDNAVGVQLDVLGQIVGVSRKLKFQPSDGSSPTTDDNTYRFLVKAKIAQNHWNGTLTGLYDVWNSSFSNLNIKIQDNQDMSFTVIFSDPIKETTTAIEMVLNGYVVPKPEAVKINFQFTTANEKIGVAENIYKTDLVRHTILGVWTLGNTPFATVSQEAKIK